MTATPSSLDAHRLCAWLSANLPQARATPDSIRINQISGGQSNPSYFVDTEAMSLVLRKQPPGELLPSAHAIDREFRVQRALAASRVPVPEMIAYCEDRSVVGTPFYLMRKLDGRVMNEAALPRIAPSERKPYYEAMVDTLAQLHAVDWQAIGLADYGKPGSYFARQVGRWSKQWHGSKLAENVDIDFLSEWLAANVPTDDTTTIAHGDFRMGNLMWHPTEPRVIGVLDWELSTLGHPYADLAYCLSPWQMPAEVYDGLMGTDLVRAGVPSSEDLVARYQAASGRREPLRPFYTAFSMFRFAVILEGVAARAKTGQSSSGDAAQVGANAKVFARRGAEIARAA